jgi:hypothetical protein
MDRMWLIVSMMDSGGGRNASERMRRAARRSGALAVWVACAAALVSIAAAGDTDWKMYAGASVSKPEICFYDAKGVVRTPERLVRVGTRCFSRKDFNKVDADKDFAAKISKDAARKLQDGYAPPIKLVEEIDFDHALLVAMYEEIANASDIQPQASISYEFNCPQRIVRDSGGNPPGSAQRGGRNAPGNWRYVAPDENEASLLKILCR